jgi:thiol:disulfide interchange protein DsbD
LGSADLLSKGLLFAFGTAFVGGFLTSLTPCVYPLIPITMSLFGARDEQVSRGRAMALAAAYVNGMGVMYACLGVFFGLAGKTFGTQLASPAVVGPIALLFLVMAASMFGAFDLNLPPAFAERLTKIGGKGLGGSFAMGLVGGIIAAPCTGPVLATILLWIATTRSVVLGASLLYTYALGMGVLFFGLAAFAARLPKSGAWMEGVKSVFGVFMIIGALYIVMPAFPIVKHYASLEHKVLYAGLGAIVLGILVGGIHLSFHHTPLGVRLRKALGVLLIVGGTWQAILWVLTPKPLAWLHDDAGIAAARAASKPALLDFYADWCLPCKELELRTFSDPEVAAEMGRFTIVKVDNTHGDETGVEERQERFDAKTLPTVVLIDSSGQIVDRVRTFVSPSEMLQRLRAVH